MKAGYRLLAGLFLVASVVPNAYASAHDAEINRIEHSLARSGPEVTLKRFFNCDNGIGWDLVSSGDPRAVKIAFAVLPHTDACYSEIMSIMLGQALSNNPRLMLGYYAKYPNCFPSGAFQA